MIESKGSGGESWDGVLNEPMELPDESTSVYREIWVFVDEVFTSSCRNWSAENWSVGEGVGIDFISPAGTGAPVFGADTDVLPALGGHKVQFAFDVLYINPERVRGEEIVLLVIDAVDIFAVIPLQRFYCGFPFLGCAAVYLPVDDNQVIRVPVHDKGGRVGLVHGETGIGGKQLGESMVIDPDPVDPVLQVHTALCGKPGDGNQQDKKNDGNRQDVP